MTSSGPQWKSWASRFKKEGKGIPILYVIRADGEQLYGKSGSLPGDGLLQLLDTASRQSGRILSAAEYETLTASVSATESAIANEDWDLAAVSLAPVSRLGTLGQLGSYAAPAMAADDLAIQIGQHAVESVNNSVQPKLAESSTVAEGILELLQTDEIYEDFPGVSETTGSLVKAAKKDPQQKELFRPALAVVKARITAMSDRPSAAARAGKSYETIINRYADTPYAEIARTELAILNAEPSVETESAETDTADTATMEKLSEPKVLGELVTSLDPVAETSVEEIPKEETSVEETFAETEVEACANVVQCVRELFH